MINTTEDIKKFINDKRFKKIFVLCGKKSFVTSGAELLFKDLLNNKESKLFYKSSELPILEELVKIINDIKSFKPDLILAVGGGAVIDYAKIANVIDVRDDLANLIINYSYPFQKKYTKLAVIPTTAGSGAEVTSNAVIYVGGIKHSFESELLLPENFFLIPEFLIPAPNKIKASAGFDAIAQALESLVSKKSNNQSVEYASRSLKISVNSYISFLNNPNLKNASEMSIASNLAGKAISISKTTAPHAVSYPFTSIYNISHGHAVSLTLNKFINFNYKNKDKSDSHFNLDERYKMMFNLSKSKNLNSFDQFISNLKQKANLENDFNKLGINIEKDFSKIISGVNILRLSNNPIKLDKEDLKRIILNN